jgi:hypothetical protein
VKRTLYCFSFSDIKVTRVWGVRRSQRSAPEVVLVLIAAGSRPRASLVSSSPFTSVTPRRSVGVLGTATLTPHASRQHSQHQHSISRPVLFISSHRHHAQRPTATRYQPLHHAGRAKPPPGPQPAARWKHVHSPLRRATRRVQASQHITSTNEPCVVVCGAPLLRLNHPPNQTASLTHGTRVPRDART